MVNKTTSFKKKGKGKRGNFKKNVKQVAAPVPLPETECFYCKQAGHCKWNYPKYLAEKKEGKVKGIFDIHVIMCTLIMLAVAPGYLILVCC